MEDGSRHFGDLPERYDPAVPEWDRIRDGVPSLPGARLTGFVTDAVTEAWIDFELEGQAFSINNQHGQWWFFVDDPACPDQLLERVLAHFEATLAPHAAVARSVGPLAPGRVRVVVYEADQRIQCRDFDDLAAAQRYADDAASETEHGIVQSVIFDAEFRMIAEGRHY